MKKLLTTLMILLTYFFYISNSYADCIEEIINTDDLKYKPKTINNNLSYSDITKKFSYIAEGNGKEFIVKDGVKGEEFDEIKYGDEYEENFFEGKFISYPIYSLDSKSYAYVGKKDGKWYIVKDGIKSEPYDNIGSIQYLNNTILLGLVQKNGKEFLVKDGVKGEEFEAVGDLLLSPNRKSYAYIGRKGGKSFVVRDGIKGEGFKGIGEGISDEYICSCYNNRLLFSPNSKHLVYIATNDNKKQFVVKDGVKGEEFNNILDLKYSPNSKYYAYIASEDRLTQFVVVNNIKLRKYNHIFYKSIKGYPNKLFYTVRQGGKEFIVVNEKELGKFDGTMGFEYLAGLKKIIYIAKSGGKRLVVNNGLKSDTYYGVWNLNSSPDNTSYNYTIQLGKNKYIVVKDGIKSEVFDGVDAYGQNYSPDSKSFSFIAEKGKKEFVVRDGVKGEEFDEIYSLLYSTDSKYFTYLAINNNKRFVVINGSKGTLFDEIQKRKFSSNSKVLYYYAEQGGKYYIVKNTCE